MGAVGLAEAGWGIKNAFQDYDKYTDSYKGDLYANGTDLGVGAADGLAILGGGAGVLGALGVVSGPIGVAGLIIGGVALATHRLTESYTTLGGAIENNQFAFENYTDTLLKTNDEDEKLLNDIYSKMKNAAEGSIELDNAKQELIKSGILSEKDVIEARKSEKDALEKLTESYIKATKDFDKETRQDMNKYSKETGAFASDIQTKLEDVFQEWNDNRNLDDNSTASNDALNMMYDIFKIQEQDLLDQNSKGLLDDDSKEMMQIISSALKDGKLTGTEANSIIDAGFWNDQWVNQHNSSAAMNEIYEYIGNLDNSTTFGAALKYGVTSSHKYMSEEDAGLGLSLLNKAALTNDIKTAKKYLDEFKQNGFKLDDYDLTNERNELQTKWGKQIDLSSYKVGSTFISFDQIAQLHQGERILTEQQNIEYTKSLEQGNTLINLGMQDLIIAIQEQTIAVVNAINNKSSGYVGEPIRFSNTNMSSTMSNTRISI